MRCPFIFSVFLLLLQRTLSSRRIYMGKRSAAEKRFMVYLVKSNYSNKMYDTWLCGGALVSHKHILTSGACLYDMSHLYAIAGTRKYVRSELLETDECTRNRKQRVVKTCLPQEYRFSYKDFKSWMTLDIGLAIVEKPYNFSDSSYRLDCDYVPAPIRISFNTLKPTTTNRYHGMVYGWGHSHGLRLPGDIGDYNAPFMQESPAKIREIGYCTRWFWRLKIDDIIENYMLCVTPHGKLDADGEHKEFMPASRSNDCSNQFDYRRRNNNESDPDCGEDYFDRIRRSSKKNTATKRHNFKKRLQNKTKTDNKRKPNSKLQYDAKKLPNYNTRRQGICQNDHGNPLVIWLGSEEYVVGVATSPMYNTFSLCTFPNLYTSTACVSRFLRCALGIQRHIPTRKSYCDGMGEEEGYVLLERDISWDSNAHVAKGELPSQNVNTTRESEVSNSSKKSSMSQPKEELQGTREPYPILTTEPSPIFNLPQIEDDEPVMSREDGSKQSVTGIVAEDIRKDENVSYDKQYEFDTNTEDVVIV